LNAIQGLAATLQAAGERSKAIEWLTTAMNICDKSFPENYTLRAQTRVAAAKLLSLDNRFDEAEKLAAEAVELGRSIRPRIPDAFTGDLQQIQQARRERQRP